MGPNDIVGKEFTCFEFTPIDSLINFNHQYKTSIGKTGVVTEINSSHPQYAYVKINVSVGKTTALHYPTQMIIDQLEQAEYDNKSTEQLLNEMKQLISKI